MPWLELADTLVRDGFVERRRDPGDRRAVRLYLTEQGRRTVAESISRTGPKWHEAFDYVDPADEAVVRKFLLLVLIGGTVIFGYLGTRTFTRRVLN